MHPAPARCRSPKRASGVRALTIALKTLLLLAAPGLLPVANTGAAEPAHELSVSDRKKLTENFNTILRERKGPFGANYCACTDGTEGTVMDEDGNIRSPCAQIYFCAAYRAPTAEVLDTYDMYVGNLFTSSVRNWDDFDDHQALVRGFVLEKYFMDTHPDHKLAEVRAYGGLSGAEYEARDMLVFFERYLSLPEFNDNRHFILAYEIQRRFFVRNEQGAIATTRALASSIQDDDPDFKPLRDETHNRVSVNLIPKLVTYRDALPQTADKERSDIEALIEGVRTLTALDESALRPEIEALESQALRQQLTALMPDENTDPVVAIEALGAFMAWVRIAVTAEGTAPADRARLVQMNVTAATAVQNRGRQLLDAGGPASVADHLRLLAALTNAAYGTGLLSQRERAATRGHIDSLLARDPIDRTSFLRTLKKIERTIEWGHRSALFAFAEVWPAWSYLLPDVVHIGDDIVRGSPLLQFGEVSTRLEGYIVGDNVVRHQLFGKEATSGIRALNPGLALGQLRVAPGPDDYSREDIVLLPETPADLKPAAGIITVGEGNVVSHVQLLARSLGIPNVVVDRATYDTIAAQEGSTFLAVTAAGTVYVKSAKTMTATDREVYFEYHRNAKREGDGSVSGTSNKLHIDRERLDVKSASAASLDSVRRKDAGIRVGPKAAFLGELKHMFPDNVTRGVVVPFGAYYEHYRNAKVALPDGADVKGIATPGEPLPDFVGRTYATFFDDMIAAGKPEGELSAWIQPRLAVMRHSIQQSPLSPALEQDIRKRLAEQGLLVEGDPGQTVGCFVRSDTNVEDLDSFNGAGLNLTIFNLKSVAEIFAGLKRVWASPFTYRSFSWRQTLIDEPLWVLPSVIILKSESSEKSGVLITADIDTGDQDAMLIATSEGVGGVVDGTPAETLVWRKDGVELVTQFKSPWRRLLNSGGGSRMVAATGSDTVLQAAEIQQLVDATQVVRKTLEPARNPDGGPRPWDIEFGFADGKLWLFQVRPFIGTEGVRNLAALNPLETRTPAENRSISLQETVH